MSAQLEKYVIKDDLHIYLQGNSTRWYARFKVGDQWLVRATKKRDKVEAIDAAKEIKKELDVLHKHGHAIQTRSFKDVARLAIENMRKQPQNVKGYASLKTYEQVLTRYHIPFFDRTHVTNIDYAKLGEFDAWRIVEMGKTPAQSTLKTHNAALQRVFDEAVQRKWMTAAQVPRLSTTQGEANQRRNAFTHEEVSWILEAFPQWIAEGRKQITKDIRQLLYFYVQIALNTGMRPGEELDNLKWGDVDDTKKNHILFNVRKGKTTLYTGTRVVVGHDKLKSVLGDLFIWNNLHDPEQLLFMLPNGATTDQLSRNFTELLKRLDLYDTTEGARTLYSLRHTYITFKLQEKMDIYALAKQCGNSIEMIQRFYGHVHASDFADDFVKETSKISKLIHEYNSEIIDFGDA